MSSRSSRLQEDEKTMETDIQTLAEQKEKIESSKKLGVEMEEKIKLMEVQDGEISERISKVMLFKLLFLLQQNIFDKTKLLNLSKGSP